MRLALLGVAMMATAASPAAARDMPLETFLQKAAALERKGAMALFSGDLRLLKAEMGSAGAAIRAEMSSAQKSGKRPSFCPPGKSLSVHSKELLDHLRAIPPAQRAGMTTTDGLRSLMARKHPCPA